MTLKDNVLFGLPCDERRYKSTIYACALEPDLKQLLAGDQVYPCFVQSDFVCLMIYYRQK
jgi:hypothetical protein